jgi:meso-butanediol dehydrogenase/(S,S)-butanediol dehydrogenase/diacetyl reductase
MSDTDRFTDAVVLITGAGSGIGAVAAARFAAEGAHVVVADIDGAAAGVVADGIPRARAVTVDVTDRAGVRAVVAEVEAVEGRVDVLINNAMTCSETPLLELTQAELERDIAVGITAAFHTVQAVLPGMIARRAGVILNMTSVNGIGYYGNEAYSAAKAALFSLTRSIAVRYGEHGIRCNGIAAGTIATPAWAHRVRERPDIMSTVSKWYPLGRVGTPDDIADAMLFLASDQASWITGTTLTVDGGLTAGNRLMTDEIVTPG